MIKLPWKSIVITSKAVHYFKIVLIYSTNLANISPRETKPWQRFVFLKVARAYTPILAAIAFPLHNTHLEAFVFVSCAPSTGYRIHLWFKVSRSSSSFPRLLLVSLLLRDSFFICSFLNVSIFFLVFQRTDKNFSVINVKSPRSYERLSSFLFANQKLYCIKYNRTYSEL